MIQLDKIANVWKCITLLYSEQHHLNTISNLYAQHLFAWVVNEVLAKLANGRAAIEYLLSCWLVCDGSIPCSKLWEGLDTRSPHEAHLVQHAPQIDFSSCSASCCEAGILAQCLETGEVGGYRASPVGLNFLIRAPAAIPTGGSEAEEMN